MNAKKRRLLYNAATYALVILAFILCNIFYSHILVNGMDTHLRLNLKAPG